ncbi:MAG: glycosyltransferase family 4 protein [Phycisphaerae bacterium]|jgi:glycosyltransferase involved in cell wall biosynthesis
MKIVFFDVMIHFGGATQLALDTSIRLAEDNDVVVIDAYGICREYLEQLTQKAIPFYILAPDVKMHSTGSYDNKLKRGYKLLCRIPDFWQIRKKLLKKVLEIKPDVIWTTSENALMFLSLDPRFFRYPVSMYVCGCQDAHTVSRWRTWFRNNRTDGLMAISSETARQLKIGGAREDNIKVVFDTIDFEQTIKLAQQPLNAPLPGIGNPKILLPATLIRTKGQHAAIEAVKLLKEQGFNPVLWLAGDVVGDDHSYLNSLKKQIEDSGLTENIHFLGWRYDIPAIMSQKPIVILPSHTEGFGHVILEAMLLWCPVAATPVGGILDSICDNVNGLFFGIDDAVEMANCIEKLTNDDMLVQRLTEQGYKTVTQRFNPPAHTHRVFDALSSIVEPKKGKG